MGKRKTPTWTFNGAATQDLGALQELLAAAARVRVAGGGCLVYAVDPADNVLDDAVLKHVVLNEEPFVDVTDSKSVQDLVEALRVTGLTNFVCMCPGDLALEFLDETGQVVTVVRIDSPDEVDWPLWAGKAKLADPAALRVWLAKHGADGPLLRIENLRAAHEQRRAEWDRDAVSLTDLP